MFWRAVPLLCIVATLSLPERMSSSRSPFADTLTRNPSGPEFVLRADVVDDSETEYLQREAWAEDDVVRAADPERAVGLEYAPSLPQPTYVPFLVLFEAPQRAVPISLVHGGYAAALNSYAATGE